MKYIIIIFAFLFVASSPMWSPVQHDSTLWGDGTGDSLLGLEALTGDVTTARSSPATTISNNAVTYAKMQDVTTARLMGRATAASGDMEEITLGSGLSYSGTTLNVVDPRITVARLASDHAISSVTATEVTLGATALAAGTYVFTYYLLVQSATATVSPMYGINFTGTAAVRKMTLVYPSTGTAASTGVADDVVAAPLATGSLYESQPVTAFTTTSPNMGHIAAVAAINADIFVQIDGIMIVTVSGDLELWHSSETATSTTIKAGSSLIVTKVN